MTQSSSPTPSASGLDGSSSTRTSVPGMFVCELANFAVDDAGLRRDLRAALPGDEPAAAVDPVAKGALALRAEGLDA